MSTFNSSASQYGYNMDPSQIGLASPVLTPAALEGGVGGFQGFVGTQLDRLAYSQYEGGAGSWAFGSMRTPARWAFDVWNGWSEDSLIADPKWNASMAGSIWGSLDPAERLAVEMAGGEQLKEEIQNSSVSLAHMRQRVGQIALMKRAELAIESFDADSNTASYSFNKAWSGFVNYAAVDPTFVVSVAAGGGIAMAAARGATASAASTLGTGAKLAMWANGTSGTARTSAWLWEGVDGASSAYSEWKQTNEDIELVYGKTRELDANVADNIMFGVGLQLGIVGLGQVLGRMMRPTTHSIDPSAVTYAGAAENVIAQAGGTLGTQADMITLTTHAQSISDLGAALGHTEGAESGVRRILMDEGHRELYGWGDTSSVQDLTKWINDNKPNSEELAKKVNERLEARLITQDNISRMRGVDAHVAAGGDPQNFYAKMAHDSLRAHMGKDYEKYRFIIDRLHEATGDMKTVAEWVARGDGSRVRRATLSIQKTAANSELIARARARVEVSAQKNRDDVRAAEIHNRAKNVIEDIREARWGDAIGTLDEMHRLVLDGAAATMRGSRDLENVYNDWFRGLSRDQRRRFSRLDLGGRIQKLLQLEQDKIGSLNNSRALSNKIMGADSSTADVLISTNQALRHKRIPDVTSDDSWAKIMSDMQAARTDEWSDDVSGKAMFNSLMASAKETWADAADGALSHGIDMVHEAHTTIMRASAAAVISGSRWNANFVDNIFGEGSTERALTTGSFPMRPVRTPNRRVARETSASIKARLDAEIAEIDKAIEDPLAAPGVQVKIDTARAEISELQAKQAKSQAIIDHPKASKKQRKAHSDQIKDREVEIAKLTRSAEIKEKALARRLDTLSTPRPVTPEVVTPQSLQAARRNAAVAKRDAAAEQLAKLPPDKYATPSGRKLRTDVRRKAVRIENETEYSAHHAELELSRGERDAAQAALDARVANGDAITSPQNVGALDEIKYLNDVMKKAQDKINKINGRPVAFKRGATLTGSKPNTIDIIDISKKRAGYDAARAAGDIATADRLMIEIIENYGDPTHLPRWPELEARLGSPDGIGSITSVGHSVTVHPPAPPAGPAGEVPAGPEPETFSSSKGAKPEALAKTADDDGSKAVAAVNAHFESGTTGERLVFASGVAVQASRIPLLRGLGRGLFRIISVGTKFASVHTTSRACDTIVTVMNLLDKPEATVSALGRKGHLFSFQNFRDQGMAEVGGMTAHYRRLLPHLPQGWEQRVNAHMYTIDPAAREEIAGGMNAQELELAGLIRERLDVHSGHHARSLGRPVDESFIPRVGNAVAIRANLTGAQQQFTAVFTDHVLTDRMRLPEHISDILGVPHTTRWSGLSVDQQTAILPELGTTMNEMGTRVSRAQGALAIDGEEGPRLASRGYRANLARTLSNETVNDPRLAPYYVQNPFDAFAWHAEHSAPMTRFNSQLTDVFGVPTNMEDVLTALEGVASRADPEVANEMTQAVRNIRSKWDVAAGRAQYHTDELLDPAFRVGAGIIRGGFGGFWGLAGLTMEIPRAIFSARTYSNGFGNGMRDILYAFRHAGDFEALSDIAHAVDQYKSLAHSASSSAYGLTVGQRFLAPWERFIRVAGGNEAIMQGTHSFGRVAGTAVGLAEALGDTATRAGGLQYFSGVARVLADRQGKRYISRNIPAMRRAADLLEGLGPIADQTPANIARFKAAMAEAGLPWDVALRMNHSGLLNKTVIDELEGAIAGGHAAFDIHRIRDRVSDRTFGSVSAFMTDVHNFHVPVQSFATSVHAKSVWDKLAYMLTSYSRAFSLNVGMRSMTNAGAATVLSTFGAVMVGENIYQSIRSVLLGREEVEDVIDRYTNNPAGEFLTNAAKSPWLGSQNAVALHAASSVMGTNLGQGRGNGLISPAVQMYRGASKMIFANERTGERDFSAIKQYTPIVNSWWSHLLIHPFTE